VRTVQRYERDLGLPVRRPAGESVGWVIATTAELDAWVKATPIRSSFVLPPPRNDESGGDSAATLRINLATMCQLREEMRALRNEVTTSIRLLRDGVEGLRGKLDLHQPLAKHLPDSASFSAEEAYVLQLLSLDRTRKAS
jgi:hypothetical protein